MNRPGTGERNEASAGSALPWEGLIHLAFVYLIWGSTFLAIRLAVMPGAGFPPFILGATRLLTAGGLTLGVAALRRRRLLPSRQDLLILSLSGVLLWGIGNGAVNWAEQRADSGLAALVIGSAPVWTAAMEAMLDRRSPSWRLVAALLTAFAGVGLLVAPVFASGLQADVLSVAALLLGAVAWAAGTVLQRRRPVAVGTIASSAYQQLAGGLWLALLAFTIGEPAPQPTGAAWAAWLYLVLIGGLAFTSFVRALELLPVPLVLTHAYVNPVIAVFLGWLVLGEQVTVWTIGGAALVVLGVAGVFRERRRAGPAQVAPEKAPA